MASIIFFSCSVRPPLAQAAEDFALARGAGAGGAGILGSLGGLRTSFDGYDGVSGGTRISRSFPRSEATRGDGAPVLRKQIVGNESIVLTRVLSKTQIEFEFLVRRGGFNRCLLCR
jgi:hypothetical protein